MSYFSRMRAHWELRMQQLPEYQAQQVRRGVRTVGVIIILAILAGAALASFVLVSAQAGDMPEDDIWRISNVTIQLDGGRYEHHIFLNNVTLEIEVVERLDGVEISRRAATADEVTQYTAHELAGRNELAVEGASSRLKSNPEQGEIWQNWVEARTLLLDDCISDGVAAQGLGSWSSMGTGQQNAVIDHLLDCGVTSNRIERKIMNSLFDLLVERGVITVN